MLQTFRERIQGWVISFIITLIVLGLGLFGLQNYWSGRAVEVVATVNGHKIYENQLNQAYDQAYEKVKHQMAQSKLAFNEETKALLKKEVLESLIKKQVEYRTALSAGFTLSPEQLESAVYSIPFLQENDTFSFKKLQQFLAFSGYTEANFLSEVEQLALIDQLKQGVFFSTFVLDNEIEELALLERQARVFDYVIIPHSAFLAQNTPSPEAIKNNYLQSQADFKDPEKVKVEYLVLDPEELKKKIAISELEIKNYYEENKAAYEGKSLAAVKDQVRQILMSEKLQTKLSTLSDQLSELTYTHENSLESAGKFLKLPIQTSEYFTREGGRGFFSDSAVVRAAFSPEVLVEGRNSDVIRLNKGVLLVLRIKHHQPSKILPLAAVKDRITSKLKIQMSQNQAAQLGEKWVDQIKKEKDIVSLMKSQKLTWKTVTTKGIGAQAVTPELLKLAFEISPESNSPKIIGKRLSKGDYALVRLQSVKLNELTLTSAERMEFRKKLQQTFSYLDYSFYLSSIMRRASITVDTQFK